MPFREELENALLEIIEALDTVADDAIVLAAGLDEPTEPLIFELIQDCRMRLNSAEALLVQVANRGGLSWDHMAGRYNVSKQAMHRRLGRRGDELYEWAQKRPIEPEFWTFDAEVVHDTARLGAAELERRAAEPQRWQTAPEPTLSDEEKALAFAWLRAHRRPWRDIVRRPDDDDRPPDGAPRARADT
jgi:hypothetical protein